MDENMNNEHEKMRILIVEDEGDLQELLRFNIEREGYMVSSAMTGERGLELASEMMPHLILLDLMLPGVDGLRVCRTLKANPETAGIPVIMLTAKGEEADIVVGLELGADDYMTKPFSPRVLIARINAVLRRGSVVSQEAADSEFLKFGEMSIYLDRYEVQVNGEAINLTATEFKILTHLAKKPNRVYTRSQLIESVHGTHVAVTERSVDVQVVALRKKLGESGNRIQTVRGIGYRFKEA